MNQPLWFHPPILPSYLSNVSSGKRMEKCISFDRRMKSTLKLAHRVFHHPCCLGHSVQVLDFHWFVLQPSEQSDNYARASLGCQWLVLFHLVPHFFVSGNLAIRTQTLCVRVPSTKWAWTDFKLVSRTVQTSIYPIHAHYEWLHISHSLPFDTWLGQTQQKTCFYLRNVLKRGSLFECEQSPHEFVLFRDENVERIAMRYPSRLHRLQLWWIYPRWDEYSLLFLRVELD